MIIQPACRAAARRTSRWRSRSVPLSAERALPAVPWRSLGPGNPSLLCTAGGFATPIGRCVVGPSCSTRPTFPITNGALPCLEDTWCARQSQGVFFSLTLAPVFACAGNWPMSCVDTSVAAGSNSCTAACNPSYARQGAHCSRHPPPPALLPNALKLTLGVELAAPSLLPACSTRDHLHPCGRRADLEHANLLEVRLSSSPSSEHQCASPSSRAVSVSAQGTPSPCHAR